MAYKKVTKSIPQIVVIKAGSKLWRGPDGKNPTQGIQLLPKFLKISGNPPN